MLLRSRVRPLKLGEVALAILLLAFAFVMPFLLFPTIVALAIVLLDRLGLSLAGKIVILLVAVVIIWLALDAAGFFTAKTWRGDVQRVLTIIRG